MHPIVIINLLSGIIRAKLLPGIFRRAWAFRCTAILTNTPRRASQNFFRQMGANRSAEPLSYLSKGIVIDKDISDPDCKSRAAGPLELTAEISLPVLVSEPKQGLAGGSVYAVFRRSGLGTNQILCSSVQEYARRLSRMTFIDSKNAYGMLWLD